MTDPLHEIRGLLTGTCLGLLGWALVIGVIWAISGVLR